MRVAGLRVFTGNASRTNLVFVKLCTDEGIDGVGEATLEWRTRTVLAALEELELSPFFSPVTGARSRGGFGRGSRKRPR